MAASKISNSSQNPEFKMGDNEISLGSNNSLQDIIQTTIGPSGNGNQTLIFIGGAKTVLHGNYPHQKDDSDDDDDDDSSESDITCDNTHELHCTPSFAQSTQRGFLSRTINYVYWNYFMHDRTFGLQYKLKQYYQKVTVARVTWLDEEKDKPIKDYYANLELKTLKEEIPIEKILVKPDGTFATSVLIEGQPGYGKTTLANKLVYDWATDASYLQRFKLCFLLPLRDLKDRKIEDGITAIAENCEFDNVADVVGVVQENLQCTLLILDGLDELSVASREEILKVLYKKQKFKDMTVIATSRTGLFNLTPEELKNLHGGVSMKSQFYDKHVTIFGIALEDRKNFLEKFVSKEKVDEAIKQLKRLTEPVAELFRSPLFLALLAIMIDNDEKITELKTKTIIYKNLFNFVIRRSCERNNIFLSEDFDIFNDNQPEHHKEYQVWIHQFGRKALQQILTNDIQFECSKLSYKIYEYGFLINHKIPSPFNSRKHFEPFHYSIMEFAAAFFLWRDYIVNKSQFYDKLIRNLKNIIVQSGGTSLVPQFLAGLMGDKVCDFFAHFLPYSHIMSTHQTLFWDVIKECTVTENLLNVLVPFIPRFGDKSDYLQENSSASEFCGEVVKFGIEKKIIPSIRVETTNLWTVPESCVVPILRIYIWETTHELLRYDDGYYDNLKSVKCEKLHFHLQNFENTEKYLELFTAITANNKTLHFEKDAKFSDCVQCLKNNYLQDATFDLCMPVPANDSAYLEFLEILLQRNHVEKIKFRLIKDINTGLWNKLLSLCVNSKSTDSLYVNNTILQHLKIDVNNFTNYGKKQWKRIVMSGVQFTYDKLFKTIEKIPLYALTDCIGLEHIKDMLTETEIPMLQCSTDVLRAILEKCKSWIGYKFVTDLLITIHCEVSVKYIWEKLPNFNNLQTLQIAVSHEQPNFPPQPQEFFIKCLASLSITNLIVISDYRSGFKYCLHLFKSQERLCNVQSLGKNLRQIDFICVPEVEHFKDELKDMCDIVSELIDCVKTNKILTTNIICCYFRTLFCILQRNIINERIFNIEHNVMQVNLPTYFLDDITVAHALTITLK